MIQSGHLRESPRVTIRLISKRVMHKNRIVAFWTRREQRDRRADEFLDAAHVFDRLRGKVGP